MPVMAPPLKATSSAGPMPLVAACAVRTLARTDTFMPMKPQAPDSTAPSTKPTARGHVEEDGDQDRQHHADDGDGLVLARQVGRGALLDGAGDLLHAGVAGVLLQDPAALDEAVEHGRQAAQQRYVQRHRGRHQDGSFPRSGLPWWMRPELSPTEAAGLSRGGGADRGAHTTGKREALRLSVFLRCTDVVRRQGVARAIRRIRASPATKDPTMSLHNVTPGRQGAGRVQRDHRDPDERRPDQVRGRPRHRRAVRRPLHEHVDALPVQLRLHPATRWPTTATRSTCWWSRRCR